MSSAGLILLAMLPLADPVHAGQPSSGIIEKQVGPDGKVHGDLARSTGWQIMRGVRWRILQRDASTRRNRSVSANRMFASGDRFRLEIEAHVCDVWLYLLNHSTDGSMSLLYPEGAWEHRKLRKGESVVLPPDGVFRFTPPAGTERLRLVASPKPLDWMNPKQLFDLDTGIQLHSSERKQAEDQKLQRASSLRRAQLQLQKLPHVRQSVDEALKRIEKDPEFRVNCKDVMLVPPPNQPESGETGSATEEIIVAGDESTTSRPLVIDLKLNHK